MKLLIQSTLRCNVSENNDCIDLVLEYNRLLAFCTLDMETKKRIDK